MDVLVPAMNVRISASIQNNTRMFFVGQVMNSAVTSIARAKETDCSINSFPIGLRRQGKNAYMTGTAEVAAEAMTTQMKIHEVNTSMSCVIRMILRSER